MTDPIQLRYFEIGDETRVALRADMAAQFDREGRVLPRGRKFSLRQGDTILAVGGLEPSGAAASFGWFLVSDMTPRQWGWALRHVREVLRWAASNAIRRIYALTPGDRPEAAAMLSRLGFRLTGQEGEDAVMTLELT